jgi:hypothetical protein
MKAVLALLVVFAGSACSAQSSGQEAIMQAIEKAVVLPEKAGSLEQYSRNYATGPDGKVIGVYVTPHDSGPADEDVGCEVMLENLESRPCTEAEEAEQADHDKALAATLGEAGQSRWFDDYLELPTILDGGCNAVTIIYDPRAKQVESAECNGEA